MKDIDAKIKEALQTSDEKWLEEYEKESGVFSLVSDTFHSCQRWLVILVFIYILIFTVLMVYCGFSFFNAETTRNQILFATGFLACFSGVSMLKIWYWMELNKHAQAREIKKLELQVARLSAKLNQ